MNRKLSLSHIAVRLALVLSVLSASSPAALAIQDSPFHLFLAGAYPFSLGTASQWVGGEYGITGGFGYQEATWPVGLQFEGMTYRFGFNDHANSFTGSDGYMQMTAGTANVTWMPEKFTHQRVKPRFISGFGVYNRVIRTTEEHLLAGQCWDPWWGYYPCAGTGTVITTSNSQTKMGLNIGASLGYEMIHGGEFFMEVRYHHAFTSHEPTQFMPMNFGFRW
jgi:hypothetical protein